jgi:hypothetical protein
MVQIARNSIYREVLRSSLSGTANLGHGDD